MRSCGVATLVVRQHDVAHNMYLPNEIAKASGEKNSEACRTKRVPTRWLVVRGQTTELEIARDGYQLIVT